MPKLVTKFKYLKPNARQSRGGYAKYIATRDGVEKLDDSQKFARATAKQRQLVQRLLKDFPDSKEMFEYDDYRQSQTVGAASEFITRAIEDNAHQCLTSKTYADYIATRPRAERFGSHGLFTDDCVQVNLDKVSADLNNYGGNVYTIIISLRREDAERLGFDNGSRWRDMLRTQTQVLAENLKIPMEHLKWFAAFHNESHHPHVHLLAHSTVENEGYLTKRGVHNLRSEFAKDIFAGHIFSKRLAYDYHAGSALLRIARFDREDTSAFFLFNENPMPVSESVRFPAEGRYLKMDLLNEVYEEAETKDGVVDVSLGPGESALFLWGGVEDQELEAFPKERCWKERSEVRALWDIDLYEQGSV